MNELLCLVSTRYWDNAAEKEEEKEGKKKNNQHLLSDKT